MLSSKARHVCVRAVTGMTDSGAPAPEHVEDDPLAPARGVVIGLVLSASFWILVALLLIRS